MKNHPKKMKKTKIMNYKVQFEEKSITAIQTVAELLNYAREEQGRTIDEAARDLQISPLYLEALEKGSYGQLPSLIYARNFVKRYGQWLGLNLPPLLEMFNQEWTLFEKHQVNLPSVPARGVAKTDFWRMPRWIRWAGSMLVIMSIFSYFGYELYTLRQPPSLVVHSPDDEVITEKQIIEISGQTEPEVALSINDQAILSDAEGNFSEMVALQPGLNVVEIQAKKKYSQEKTVFRKIVVEDKPVITTTDESEPVS